MKKIYIAPITEKKTITSAQMISLSNIGMGEAGGEGEDITADVREENHNHNIWDIEW